MPEHDHDPSTETAGVSRRRFLTASTAAAGVAGLALTGAGRATATPAAEFGPVSVQRPLRIYGDDKHPVWHRRPLPLDTPRARHPQFPSGYHLLEKGTVRRDGAKVLPCDIALERDVPVTMRDGTRIFTNVFRPTAPGRYPVVFGWCPYGKEVGGQWLDDTADRDGVPLREVSELQRFEGADPAYWVDHGYVVLSPDPRGVGRSGGNIAYWGRQLAEDGYDFIEWAAHQAWSSGKVAMTGNSYLAVSQWFIAAEQPPHLAAIAPWEGFSDHFREAGNRGGIPAPQFSEQILETFAGRQLLEDQPLMMTKEQFRTPYWLDKQARLERITVPAYVVASWTNPAHTHGTFAGYRQIASREKWLRVHNSQEWRDYYTPANVEDLRRFLDHYLKGTDNGWASTPKVRLSVLDPGGTDVVNRVEHEFPLARTRHTPLYLTADGGLVDHPVSAASSVGYDITGHGGLTFTRVFDERTELTGYLSLRLWVEAQGSSDMELAITVQKLDADGRSYGSNPMQTVTATGYLRVSQRRLARGSTPSEPLLLNQDEQLLSPGQIVPVDINIWPMGMIYHPGQSLQLTVAENAPPPAVPDMGMGVAALTLPADGGTYRPGAPGPTVTLGGSTVFPDYVVQQRPAAPVNRNRGRHVLHLGGRYDARLLVPTVPATSR